MRIRRIALVTLALVSLLFILDLRCGPQLGQEQSSVRFDVRPRLPIESQASKTQRFSRPQGGLVSLVLDGSYGTVQIKSGTGEELVVSAAVLAQTEEDLERVQVVETVTDSEISYGLAVSDGMLPDQVGVGYQVELPAGMEVAVQYSHGKVEIEDFVGYLRLVTRFCSVEVRGLAGSLSVDNQFGNLKLEEIAGPLTLDDAFATSTVQLLAIDGGYDFQIEVSNGTLSGDAPVERQAQRDMITAAGSTGAGRHPVAIRSTFGSVTVNLER